MYLSYFSSPACQSYTFYILLGPRLAQISTYLANPENQSVLVNVYAKPQLCHLASLLAYHANYFLCELFITDLLILITRKCTYCGIDTV